jgi:tRNA (guanine37-N1)-methyltransferase
MTLRIDVLTLFPDSITDYATTSVLGRARAKGAFDLHVHDFRDKTSDVHRSVDDTPFGGGAGMVLSPDPIVRTLEETPGLRRPVIALTPSGVPFNHAKASALSELEGFTLLCGRYEGFDQRILDSYVDEEVSLGDFVLAGGELAAMCVMEAVVRLLPGALGNDASAVEESFFDGLLEYPHYTKPASYRDEAVPEILRSGDHAKIGRWRKAQALAKTAERRPDLIEARGGISDPERAMLKEFGLFAPMSEKPLN